MPVPMKDDGRPKVLLTKEEVYRKYSKGYKLKRRKKRRFFSFLFILLLILLIFLYLFSENDFINLVLDYYFNYFY